VKTPILFLFILVCWPSLGCSPAFESTDPAGEAEAGEPEPASVTLLGERVLLFMEYPHLVRGEEARFLVHLSVLATGAPVRSGRVVLQVGDTRLAVDGPARDGVFVPEGSLPAAGRFQTRLVLTSDRVDETLVLGEVVVHATAEDAAAAAADDEHEHEDGIRFLLEQQWKVGLLLSRAAPRTVTRRLIVPADVVPAEGASAVVSAPVAGRLLPPDGGALPRTGDVVDAGQILALVEPPLGPADAAQLRALELEWDLKALEVEQQLAEAESHLRYAEADHARIADLRGDGLSTQQQLDQAERDRDLARGADAAARAAIVALGEQRARRIGMTTLSPEGMLRFVAQAPIAGVLVAEGHVVGESLEAHETLYRIVDGSRVWIEGRVSEFELPQVTNAPVALVTFPAAPGLRLAVGEAGTGGEPVLSPEVDVHSRTVILRYELVVTDDIVRPGMLAELEVAVEAVDADVVIPYEAVVLEGGLPFAYVMHGGELFERRELDLGLRDGDLVEVRSGVEAGEHVVTRGAMTVRMAAMAPASFGHQHQH
jgi:RND family efflux transporter MFP subunit